ncbi:MAG: UDP-N-acetylmuramoyl-L-alanyl-D-glutamate--2,6-diaminopimelate ligase [Actinomycetota bacterium]|nr:UDP-N-acetylmuramoyl-L-alanyl-D-glutamate--2,6-diaminopimelate ligase [Actinomycetota bacterium]
MTGEPTTHSLAALARAARDLLVEAPSSDIPVSGLSFDSRAVGERHLFFCVPGTVSDGHDYATAAVAAGAVALVVERPTGAGVPEVLVTDARRAMARIAAEFYDRPGDDLMLLGVTGTNGKTTTAFLLESILTAGGLSTGLIGTIETRVAGRRKAGVRTTPESLDLQALLAEMREAGATAVSMEVTSHALVMHRVESLRFAVAGFTNLSQDHLDFHSSMEDYFAAKRMLFTHERAERGATNVDDPSGLRVFEESSIPCVGFGADERSSVRALDVRSGPWGSEFVLDIDGVGETKVSTALVGHFNISNCLAAASMAWQAGIDLDTIQAGIERLRAVPGRFEAVDAGQPFTVVVDYAHTPDSLDNVLRGARALAGSGRVVCTFGCGGDRDRGKRPLMGAVAAKLADFVVVTSDNPRSEDPHAIIDSILEGVIAERPDGPDAVLADRKEAIGRALAEAREGDVVVVAGKGHETGQEFRDHTIPFDDREVARDALGELGYGGDGA